MSQSHTQLQRICVWPKRVADFESDWIRELLPDDYIVIDDEEKRILYPNTPCMYVFNFWQEYMDIISTITHDYGVFYLGDELLSNRMAYLVSDPKCKIIWRNYVHHHYFNVSKVRFFPCAYKKGFSANNSSTINTTKPTKKYMWSFAGAVHGAQRIDALNAFKAAHMEPYYVHPTPANSFNAAEGISTETYRKLIEESAYVLSPPGSKIMECSRLYEALEGKSVPVAIANFQLVHITPSYHHAVFPPESAVGPIPFIIGENWDQAVAAVKAIEMSGTYYDVLAKCTQYWADCKAYWKTLLKADTQALYGQDIPTNA